MTNIIHFDGKTKLDLDPDKLLQAAIGELTEVVILGYTKDGSEYLAFSKADGATVNWHCDRAKLKLLQSVDI